MSETMKIKTLVPWYGSNRMLADKVAEALAGSTWVGVPFGGGLSEVAKITARTIVVNDLHRHVMNLAACVAHKDLQVQLTEWCDKTPFHPDALALSQRNAANWELNDHGPADIEFPDVIAAYHYFVSSWMARSATAGTDREFSGGLALRWEAGGGDSAKRFYNAAKGLAEWWAIMQRCTFSTLDFFEWIEMVKDAVGHGVYIDAPFPGPGDKYKHKFGVEQIRRMAARLLLFKKCRIVCRFYDVPLVRELFPESEWKWLHLEGRKQSNAAAPEVLLVRN